MNKFGMLRLMLVLFLTNGIVIGACPSADISGDCMVDLEDFAIMALSVDGGWGTHQWYGLGKNY